jgi:hypothetical protein
MRSSTGVSSEQRNPAARVRGRHGEKKDAVLVKHGSGPLSLDQTYSLHPRPAAACGVVDAWVLCACVAYWLACVLLFNFFFHKHINNYISFKLGSCKALKQHYFTNIITTNKHLIFFLGKTISFTFLKEFNPYLLFMSYWINSHLTFLLVILGCKNLIYTLYHMLYHTNMMLMTWFNELFYTVTPMVLHLYAYLSLRACSVKVDWA